MCFVESQEKDKNSCFTLQGKYCTKGMEKDKQPPLLQVNQKVKQNECEDNTDNRQRKHKGKYY